MKKTWDRKLLFGQVLIFIAILNLTAFILVRSRYRQHNPELTEAMLTTVSNLRQKHDDPCAASIVGQPDAGLGYVKLSLNCQEEESLSSFDLRAIKNNTVAGLLTEFARIGAFEVEIAADKLVKYGKYDSTTTTGWFCLSSNDRFESLVKIKRQLVPKETLYCFYDDYDQWQFHAQELSLR